MRRLCTAAPLNETRLLHEAASAYPHLEYVDLSGEALARITEERGVDFATALFYDRVRRSPEHAPFIAELEALRPDLGALPRLCGKLVVAPAAVYREHPETGGDGALVREIAAEFGLETALAAVPGGGTVSGNAALLRAQLAQEPPGSVILVSMSKGGADARVALAEGGAPLRAVRVWVQICGLVRGTPLADRLMDSPWRRALIGLHFAYRRWELRLLHELRRRPGSLLSGLPETLPGVRVINVVGFPLTPHVLPEARARHRRLAGLGPNDGTSLLRDQILEPGPVYPVWGADHYFHVPQLAPLLYWLFTYLAREARAEATGRTPGTGAGARPPEALRNGGTASRP